MCECNKTKRKFSIHIYILQSNNAVKKLINFYMTCTLVSNNFYEIAYISHFNIYAYISVTHLHKFIII